MNSVKPVAVLDTDVASYVMKGVPIAWEYLTLLHGYQPGIAFITAAELRFGAERRDWGTRRRLRLDLFLQECLILPHEEGMARVYANVMANRERVGRRLEKADGWIATTAIYHKVPLVTHDSDFVGTPGLRIITASTEARAAQLRLPVVGQRPLNLDMRCQCGL